MDFNFFGNFRIQIRQIEQSHQHFLLKLVKLFYHFFLINHKCNPIDNNSDCLTIFFKSFNGYWLEYFVGLAA